MEEDIVKLPNYEVIDVVRTLSQTMDWGLISLNIPQTWAKCTGKDIVVLVVDTGCPGTKTKRNGTLIHPDLEGAVDTDRCKTFISDEDIFDYQGHSTHCAGIIGARNNSFGCVGYAPECTIVTYKCLNRFGVGSNEAIAKALNYAADTLHPDIVSMSLGSTAPNEEIHKAIKRLYDMNIPVIAAGGNGGAFEGVNYPAKYDETIAIGAYDMNKNVADFSAVGDDIDLVFPGVKIYSTYINYSYALLDGTSMATPAAAGVVALLLEKHHKQEKETGANDCKTVAQIKEHLIKYSKVPGDGKKSATFGWGIVDVDSMLAQTIVQDKVVVDKPKTFWQKIAAWFKR